MKVLVIFADAIGRMNACAGITRKLLNRGHKVIFLIEQGSQGKLKQHGFDEFIRKSTHRVINENDANKSSVAKQLLSTGLCGRLSSLDKMQIFIHHFLLSENARHGIMNRNEDIRDAIVQCRPDLIILDHIYLPPAVSYSKVPWIRCISSNPLVCLFDDDLPPGGSGYSLDDKRTAEWSLFKQIHRQLFYSRMFNSYLCNMGYAPYEREMVMPQTQLLTIYALPDEMNYTQIKAKELWFNIEAFNKDQVDHSTDLYQLMPVSFLIDSLDGQFSGKWIYLSMGTMGSANVDLMKRLVNVLGKTKHKYIVSKGPLHSEYELASNMWGDDYVPQIDIIKFVDLVISHGGHNTVTETMAQGKPMVVMPLFWDQFDNAQRLHQLELSVWLDPFEFTEWQLHSAISRLLGDNELNTRLRNIAIRIQSSCAHEKLCNKIENLLGKV